MLLYVLNMLTLALLSMAAPANVARTPTATIRVNGHKVTFHGSAGEGHDSYLGIPFAEARPLRFKPPMAKKYNATTYNASSPGPMCLQGGGDARGGPKAMSEDCLFLQILTPPGVAGGHKKVPVMVWIYGGAFTGGASSLYTSAAFMQYAASIDRPVVWVAMNYRVDIFGFAYGRDVAVNKAANLGLRDQKLALEWVKKNIKAFGGDPKKVTLYGQSAGAISTAYHLLNPKQDLFRGAIMHSGAPSTAPITNTSTGWDNKPYELTAQNAGCMAPNTANLGNRSTWECLSTVDGLTLLNASMSMKKAGYQIPFVWAPAVDGDVIPRSPYDILQAGTFSRIPFITGNVRDEGTGFLPKTINGTFPLPMFVNAIEAGPVDNATTAALAAAYPNSPALGSPYGTGNETFGLDPIFKQVASLVTDMAFQSRRRYLLRQVNKAKFAKTWSFEFWGLKPGTPPYMGVAHSMEVDYVYGHATLGNNYTAANVQLGQSMMGYWLNFAYYLDPNGKKGTKNKVNGTEVNWLPYGYPKKTNQVLFNPGNITIVQDDYRADQMKVFDGPERAVQFNFKRWVL